MRNVLIFAHECAPHHRTGSTIGAQRPAMFAKYLPHAGWRPIIICCDVKYRRTATSSDIPMIVKRSLDILNSSDPTNAVIIPVPSLRHSGNIDKLWYSLVTSNEEQGTFAAKNKLASVIRKPLTISKLFSGDYSESWQPVAAAVAEAIAQQHPISICIGEHGPDAGLFLSRSFASRFNIPWIADFRDPILQPQKSITRFIYRFFIKNLLKKCSATINVTPFWKALDEKLFKLPSYCITNGYDEEDFKMEAEKKNHFTVFYTGSFKPQVQDLHLFFSGFKRFIDSLSKEEKKMVRFYYRGLGKDTINKMAIGMGIEEQVDVTAFIPRHELIKAMISSDILLLLSATPANRSFYYSKGFYPGKTFEYFGAGKPILCVPGDGGVLDQLIKETNTGVIKSNPEEISAYLRTNLDLWKQGRAIPFAPVTDVVAKYTRKEQALELGKILNQYSLKN